MNTAHTDLAWANWLKGKQERDRIKNRRELLNKYRKILKKYPVLIASSAVSISVVGGHLN